jgi:quinoprotein relay system zinc metallohydrolase 2
MYATPGITLPFSTSESLVKKTFGYLMILLLVIILHPAIAAEKQGLSVEEVAPGIFVHFGVHELPDKKNQGAIANIGFIIGKRCVAVIDTGGNPGEGRALRLAIKESTTLPVCYVINTHVHPDHIYGNSAFKDPGVKFVGHKNLSRAMAMRGPYYIKKADEQLGVKLSDKDFVPPDLIVSGHYQLDLGDRILMLTAHPTAHTDNDLSIYDVQSKTLWLSDLLFIDHIPVIDGSLKGWLQVLEQLQKRQAKLVIPGHGPVVTDWPKSMQPEKAYLQMLLEEIRTAIKQGVYLKDAVQSVGNSAKGQWELFDQLHRKNVTTAYAELEWED